MKKLLILLMISVVFMAVSVPALAQSVVPEQSVGNVSMSAYDGLHLAHHNVMDNNGIASHVFHVRFMPAFHPH